MKLLSPLSFLLGGAAFFAFGVIYHMLFAGLPYQDPTPEVYANWRFHSRIGNSAWNISFLLILTGVLWGCVRWLRRLVGRLTRP